MSIPLNRLAEMSENEALFLSIYLSPKFSEIGSDYPPRRLPPVVP